jgi:hypothetical protein
LYEYLRAAAICGLDARTALMMPPGAVFDMIDTAVPDDKSVEDD